jgi:hypothetical protein
MKPSLFYGTAISTCLGLALGLTLHGPWADAQRPGGPQIYVASAAAAELARPVSDSDVVQASAPVEEAASGDSDLAYAAGDQLAPDSPPLVRLTRMGGPARPAAADVQRVSIDAASQDADDVATAGDLKDDADAEGAALPSHSLAYAAIAYTTSSDH